MSAVGLEMIFIHFACVCVHGEWHEAIRKPSRAEAGGNRRRWSEAERAGAYCSRDRDIDYCQADAKRKDRRFRRAEESLRLAKNHDPAKIIGKSACIIRLPTARRENSSSVSGKVR